MNQRTSTNSNSVIDSEHLSEHNRLRHVERKLDYSISRFGVAMDHLATKVNGTANFLERVGEVVEAPKRGLARIKANPDPYVRNTFLVLGAISAIKVLKRDYELVSPFRGY